MMKRPIVLIILAALVLAAAVVAALVLADPQPTGLAGDPWDYNLSIKDLPEDWKANSARIQTAYELALLSADTSGEDAILPSSAGLLSTHYTDFNKDTGNIFYLSSQVILYDTTQTAHNAFTAEAPGPEWEKLTPGKTIGEETTVWHLIAIPEAPDQASYRVDFRYLNGIGSIGVTGTTGGMNDDKVALEYAAKILDKMQKSARPEALKTLSDASRPDLRTLMLDQNQLAELDSRLGERWAFDDRQPPTWTPNSSFTDPDGLAGFGRIMGYQAFMIKLLNPEEVEPALTAGFFQQVTAYEEADKAQQILAHMAGLGSGLWETPPNVGDSARAWSEVFQSEGGQSQIIAVTEIGFQVGAYIGSVRTQTVPLLTTQVKDAREANQQLAQKLAEALADNLKAAGK
jgi:hypothetical protein